MASGVRIFEILVEYWRVLPQESPEHFVGAKYLHRVGHVEVMDQVKLVDQIAEADEARLRPRLMDQEHGGQVAHSLYVSNVRPKAIERSQDVFQRRAQTMHFLKERIEMWKSSRNVLEDQGRLLKWLQGLGGAQFFILCLRLQGDFHLAILFQGIGGLFHHNIVVEGIENVRINPELITDHACPNFTSITHRYVALHDLADQLAVLLVG